MSEFVFEPATKDQAKARIALAGPSGAGKTWTSLVIASALGGRVAVIDTERGSASKYASDFAFDRLNLHRYDPRDMAKALAAAAQAGYEVVIVDSLSKFWSGAGGMLEQVDNAARRSYGSNSFGGWKEARPMETDMIEALLGYPGHVIVTMRTKTAYEVIEDDRGRKVPQKIGLKPEQREGIEYEFDIVGDMDLQNALTVSKSRCRSLSGRVIQRPDASLGEEILGWLTDGKPAMSATEYRDALCAPGITAEDVKQYGLEIDHRGLNGAAVMDDTGETVKLRELALRKYQEATRDGNGHAPQNGQRANGRKRQAAPANGTSKPAGTEGPGLDPADPWALRVEEIADDADATDMASEVTDAHDNGGLDDAKFRAVMAAIDARVASLAAAANGHAKAGAAS